MLRTDHVSLDPSHLLARRLSGLCGKPIFAAELGPLHDVRSHHTGDDLTGTLKSAASGMRFILAGWVAESVSLEDGRRQIIGLRLPGDRLAPPGEGVETAFLTAGRTAVMSGPPVGPALEDLLLAEEHARLRQLVVRLGRCSAHERTAHLLLELHERLLRIGLAAGDGFHLPLTQEVLADALGLSIVHVNRTLQQLRREGCLVLHGAQATFPNRKGLASAVHYTLSVATPPPPAAALRRTGGA